MDTSFELVRKDQAMLRLYGEDMKCYGRDSGGKREGRRNFIEHTEYVAEKEDGSKRSRVRYNIEGHDGQALGFVFAEVSNSMPSGEFVYVMVQNKRGGAVSTLVDNRSAIKAGIYGKTATGGLGALLGGGGK
jgi:import inner membrane translocase subunit TIM21